MSNTTMTIHTRPRASRTVRRGCRNALATAGVLLLMPIAAVAQVPGDPTSPPAPTAQPPHTGLPLASPVTKIYRGDDGSALYLRAVSSTVVGFAEHPDRNYAFVFRGTRTGNVIAGNWYDVAKGTRTSVGAISLTVFKQGDRLVRSSGADFGPDVFTVIDPRQVPWPGAREAGFQDRSRSELDGAFVGKTITLEPDGSRSYWREAPAFGAVGVAEGPTLRGSTRPAWVSVFFGKRDSTTGKVAGDFFDVPKGTATQRGTFSITPFPRRYGRFYGLTQWGTDNIGVAGRGGIIDADYAMNFDKFAAAVDTYFRGKVVGFGYAISYKGDVVRSDSGGNAYLSQTNTEFDVNQPFGTITQSDIGSSSKLVVATAVMRELVARGISVDAAVASYFPSCWNLGAGWETMTFRQLLTHTSGLVRPSNSLLSQDPTGYLFQKASAEGALGPKDPAYENQNYVMLGWILAGMLDKAKVEASFEENGCGAGTPAMLETMEIFEAYVVDMLADQGVEGGWKWRDGPKAFLYNFADQSLSGPLSASNINPSGGLKMSADELGEFLAKLDDGRFVTRSTVQVMKDLQLGFDGPLNPLTGGLGQMSTKNGATSEGGRGAGSQVAMLPGGVQVLGIWNSKDVAVPAGVAAALLAAWESAIK